MPLRCGKKERIGSALRQRLQERNQELDSDGRTGEGGNPFAFRRMRQAIGGTAAVDFVLVALLYMIPFGLFVDGGLLMWTQMALEHSVALAARCASADPILCGDTKSIQNYAAAQAYGLTLAPSVFAVAISECGVEVTATYSFRFIGGPLGSDALNLGARACFSQ